jgi:hypothetical protein
LIVKGTGVEDPALVPGLYTVSVQAPGSANADAGITTVSCVKLTKVAGRITWVPSVLFVNATDPPLRKSEPVMVSVRAEAPELALVGEIEVTLGAGAMPEL